MAAIWVGLMLRFGVTGWEGGTPLPMRATWATTAESLLSAEGCFFLKTCFLGGADESLDPASIGSGTGAGAALAAGVAGNDAGGAAGVGVAGNPEAGAAGGGPSSG